VAITLYPSIHIRDGHVARLTRGADDLEDAELIDTDAANRAKAFAALGFSWLHVVDLNGAFEGRPVNVEAVEAILKNAAIPVQLSGGMRSMEIIGSWFDKGVARVVLASAAVQNPELVREACKAFPGRIAVKIDSLGGYVATTGWTRAASMKALDLALRVEEAGAAAIIYADINRDGALGDVNVEAISDLAFALHTPVIASGGVNSLQDLAELKAHAGTGVAGLILGGALYSGKIKAEDALKLAAA
jgi:phosphoribosylformimino-5-aminoimidazole carboxamide ribotide isomerase